MDHFIKQWRKFRGLTMEQMAEGLELSNSTLSRVERGRQAANTDLLEKIATMLGCTVGDLLMRDPRKPDDMWALWQTMTAQERARLFAVARALKDVDAAIAAKPVETLSDQMRKPGRSYRDLAAELGTHIAEVNLIASAIQPPTEAQMEQIRAYLDRTSEG